MKPRAGTRSQNLNYMFPIKLDPLNVTTIASKVRCLHPNQMKKRTDNPAGFEQISGGKLRKVWTWTRIYQDILGSS